MEELPRKLSTKLFQASSQRPALALKDVVSSSQRVESLLAQALLTSESDRWGLAQCLVFLGVEQGVVGVGDWVSVCVWGCFAWGGLVVGLAVWWYGGGFLFCLGDGGCPGGLAVGLELCLCVWHLRFAIAC